VRNFTRSGAYARVRLGIGTAAALLGATLIVRTAAGAGFAWAALGAYVLGLALMGLGVVRWYEFLHARGRR